MATSCPKPMLNNSSNRLTVACSPGRLSCVPPPCRHLILSIPGILERHHIETVPRYVAFGQLDTPVLTLKLNAGQVNSQVPQLPAGHLRWLTSGYPLKPISGARRLSQVSRSRQASAVTRMNTWLLPVITGTTCLTGPPTLTVLHQPLLQFSIHHGFEVELLQDFLSPRSPL